MVVSKFSRGSGFWSTNWKVSGLVVFGLKMSVLGGEVRDIIVGCIGLI